MVEETQGRVARSGPEVEKGWQIGYGEHSLSRVLPTQEAAESLANDDRFRMDGPRPTHIVGPDGQQHKLPWE